MEKIQVTSRFDIKQIVTLKEAIESTTSQWMVGLDYKLVNTKEKIKNNILSILILNTVNSILINKYNCDFKYLKP